MRKDYLDTLSRPSVPAHNRPAFYFVSHSKKLSDREKWNRRYREQSPGLGAPPPAPIVAELAHLLPETGAAIDAGGGTGRHAIWLARRGFVVTIADVSEVALELADKHAAAAHVRIQTVCIDLENATFPPGPWDLVLSYKFIHRPLFDVFPRVLNADGVLLFVQPTRSNLERNPKPGPRHLLENGELPTLVHDLEIIQYREGWIDNEHLACLLARKKTII